jgi:hypothetical protein
MAMNVEAEIRELKPRMSEIEGSFGFLTQQVRTVHKDLLTFQAKTEQEFKNVNGRLDRLDQDVRGLRRDMPGIVVTAMREANRASTRKPRMACPRFRRHRVRCFDGAGGGSWRDGSLRESSSLKRCA